MTQETFPMFQLINGLKCQKHQQNPILQVCVSSQCAQQNRVCCLQCVDEHHIGTDHILISCRKFSKLIKEFHILLKEKQSLNSKLTTKLQSHQVDVHSYVDRYYNHIKESLSKENQLTSYEQLNKIDSKTLKAEEIRNKINSIIDDHSWMLEMNCKAKSKEYIPDDKTTVEHLRSKYNKLQKRLEEINYCCEEDIRKVLQKRSIEVKKLLHLFDEIKYDLSDEGKTLQEVINSMTKLKIEGCP